MHAFRDPQLRQCDACDEPAVWVRRTQFSGSHYFCTKHAHQEENFGQEHPSYFFWEKLTPEEGEE
jgi:hypothetical protein